MNSIGTNRRALAEALDVRGAGSWSPDSKWIAVAANQGEGTRIFKVPIDGGPPVPLTGSSGRIPTVTNLKRGFRIVSFDVAPDGKTIIFDRQQEHADVWLMELKD